MLRPVLLEHTAAPSYRTMHTLPTGLGPSPASCPPEELPLGAAWPTPRAVHSAPSTQDRPCRLGHGRRADRSLPFSSLVSWKPPQVHLEPPPPARCVPKPLRVLPTSRATRWVTSATTCQVTNPFRLLTHSLGWASALLLNPKTAFSHSRSFPWLWFKETQGSSLMLHWLRLSASTAGGNGSIPGWGTKIMQPKKKKN